MDAAEINEPAPHTLSNGIEMTIEQLEQELPFVYDGQIPLGDLLQRVMQAIYAELSELAETSVSLISCMRS